MSSACAQSPLARPSGPGFGTRPLYAAVPPPSSSIAMTHRCHPSTGSDPPILVGLVAACICWIHLLSDEKQVAVQSITVAPHPSPPCSLHPQSASEFGSGNDDGGGGNDGGSGGAGSSGGAGGASAFSGGGASSSASPNAGRGFSMGASSGGASSSGGNSSSRGGNLSSSSSSGGAAGAAFGATAASVLSGAPGAGVPASR